MYINYLVVSGASVQVEEALVEHARSAFLLEENLALNSFLFQGNKKVFKLSVSKLWVVQQGVIPTMVHI